MTRDQLFQFIKEMTGNKVIVASPKKKQPPTHQQRKEVPSPTRSEASRGKMLPGISARSQVRPPLRKRRGDMEKEVEGTTRLIADDENFSAVCTICERANEGTCCPSYSFQNSCVQFSATKRVTTHCYINSHALPAKTGISSNRNIRRIRIWCNESHLSDCIATSSTTGLATG